MSALRQARMQRDNGNFCLPILHSELHGYPQTIPVLLWSLWQCLPNFFRRKTKGPIWGQARSSADLTTSGSKEDLDNGGGSNLGGIPRQGEEKRRHREQYMTNRCSRPSRALITDTKRCQLKTRTLRKPKSANERLT